MVITLLNSIQNQIVKLFKYLNLSNVFPTNQIPQDCFMTKLKYFDNNLINSPHHLYTFKKKLCFILQIFLRSSQCSYYNQLLFIYKREKRLIYLRAVPTVFFWKLVPSLLVASLLIFLCRSRGTISSNISPSPLINLHEKKRET